MRLKRGAYNHETWASTDRSLAAASITLWIDAATTPVAAHMPYSEGRVYLRHGGGTPAGASVWQREYTTQWRAGRRE